MGHTTLCFDCNGRPTAVVSCALIRSRCQSAASARSPREDALTPGTDAVVVTTMSFGGSAVGGGFDYGDFLLRRARKVLAWIFLLSLAVFPRTTTAALLEWSTEKARAVVDIIVDSLPATPGSTTSTTQP